MAELSSNASAPSSSIYYVANEKICKNDGIKLNQTQDIAVDDDDDGDDDDGSDVGNKKNEPEHTKHVKQKKTNADISQ